MSFLTPLFLAGIALLVGPILFHLIRQVSRKRIVFSSTELLDDSEPKTEKSRRIQNPVLLIIRCLIIALLAFAFARPFIPNTNPSDSANSIRRDVVIAIDGSASMSRSNLAQSAVEEAKAVIEALAVGDQLSVFSFSDTITQLISLEQWTELPAGQRKRFALAQLESWQPAQFPGALDRAVREAASQIENQRERSTAKSYGEIYVISDFAEGTSLSEIELIEWPEAVRFNRIKIPTIHETPNLGLRWLGWNLNGQSARIGVSNSIPNESMTAQLLVSQAFTNRQVSEPIEITLDGVNEQVVTVPLEAGASETPLLFQIVGDDSLFNNTLHVAPAYIPELTIGLFSEHLETDAQNAVYFISKGIAGFDSPKASLLSDSPANGASDSYLIDRPLSRDEATPLRLEIVNGKSALLIADGIEIKDTITALTDISGWGIEERDTGHLLVGEVDFEHSLFRPFADSRFSNFANLRIWQSPRIDVPESEGSTIIARFDDGTPLLVEVQIGQGRLFLWAGGWAPSDSQWVLSSKFIPFLHRFALLASGGPSLESNLLLTHRNLERYREIVPSESIETPRLIEVAEQANRWLAFQLDPQESRTQIISEDRWDQLGLPEYNAATQQAQLEAIAATIDKESATRIEEKQHIWQWLLWAVLALLAIESATAIVISKREEVTS